MLKDKQINFIVFSALLLIFSHPIKRWKHRKLRVKHIGGVFFG